MQMQMQKELTGKPQPTHVDEGLYPKKLDLYATLGVLLDWISYLAGGLI